MIKQFLLRLVHPFDSFQNLHIAIILFRRLYQSLHIFRETRAPISTTGQNALSQLKEFKEVTDITGIILTKMDGTAKGGIAVAIQAEYGIPVKYIGVGEKVEDLQKFDSNTFVNALFDVAESE